MKKLKRFCHVSPTLSEVKDPKRQTLEGFVKERMDTSGDLLLEYANSTAVRYFSPSEWLSHMDPSDAENFVTGGFSMGEIDAEWDRQYHAAKNRATADEPAQNPKPEVRCPWCGGTKEVRDEYGRPAPCSCTMRRDEPQDRMTPEQYSALAMKVQVASQPTHKTLRDGTVISNALVNVDAYTRSDTLGGRHLEDGGLTFKYAPIIWDRP